jgi:hypothetical protein
MLIIENVYLIKIYLPKIYFNSSYTEQDTHKSSGSSNVMLVTTGAYFVSFYQGLTYDFNQNQLNGST